MNRCWKCNDNRPCHLEHCGLKEAAVTAPEKMSDEQIRAAFEAWALRYGWDQIALDDKCFSCSPRAGEYRHQGLQDAWEVWFAATIESARDAQWQAVLANRTPSGYATCNDDGDITMMWRAEDLAEARTYCGDGEEPISLYR